MPDKQPIPTVAIKPLTAEQVKSKTVISEDFYTVFSNHVRVTASLTEFRLFFGESFPAANDEMQIIEQFCVALTPVQAKMLFATLSEIIQKLELILGTIPTAEALQQKFQSKSADSDSKDTKK